MNTMKVIIVIFLLGIFSVFSQKNIEVKTEDVAPSIKLTPKQDRQINLNLQNQIIKSLKSEFKYKLDSLVAANKKAKKIYVNRYIKIYRTVTVPIYIPAIDSNISFTDTLNDVYLKIQHRNNIIKKLFKKK